MAQTSEYCADSFVSLNTFFSAKYDNAVKLLVNNFSILIRTRSIELALNFIFFFHLTNIFKEVVLHWNLPTVHGGKKEVK